MNKISFSLAALAAGVVLVGCSKCEADDKCEGCKPAEQAAAVAAEEIVAEVNGKQLTRAQLDKDIATLLAKAGDKIPAEHIADATRNMREQIVQTFVFENVMCDKAKQGGYLVTDADRDKAKADFAKTVAGQPNAPKDFDAFAAEYPLGSARAYSQLDTGILVDKMIRDVLEQDKTDFTKEAQKVIDNIVSNNAERIDKGPSPEAALKKIQEIRAQLTDPACTNLTARFAELAAAESSCPSGKRDGGNLGAFVRGQMVKEFSDVAFSLPVGQLSEPVKTDFGYHLILVTEKIPAVAAEGDKPAQPEKVKASHILIAFPRLEPVPTLEEVTEYFRDLGKRKITGKFITETVGAAKIKVCEEFKYLLPPTDAK